MSLPTYEHFVFPLLRVLCRNPKGLKPGQARSQVAADLELTSEELSTLLPSGQQTYFANRIGWAHDRLKRQGLSSSPRRAYWVATEAGHAFLADHGNGLTDEQRKALVFTHRLPPTSNRGTGTPTTVPAPIPSPQPPQERIEEAVQELRQSLSGDLMEQIMRMSPDFFERLVLDLLVSMGYGVSRADFQRTGGPGDGGIDGVIALDKLGLQKVYVQAKRWKPGSDDSSANTVGRPEIQAFFGALAGRRAQLGVFITTSRFTRSAEDYASRVSDTIVLVDGARLTDLMIDHEVGVSLKRVHLPRIDTDYFDE